MMRMTARQIRAYLQAAVKIRARECLEEASIASIHAMDPKEAKRLLDAWFYTVHPGTEEETKFIDGKLVKVYKGEWKVVEGDSYREIFQRGI